MPHLGEYLLAARSWHSKRLAVAAAAGEQTKYQARALGRAAVHAAPHAQRAVPAVYAGVQPLGVVELGFPYQGRVAKQPQILFAAPAGKGSVQFGLGVREEGIRNRHGPNLQSHNFFWSFK